MFVKSKLVILSNVKAKEHSTKKSHSNYANRGESALFAASELIV